MVTDKKARQKLCTWKGTKNQITVPEQYCSAEYGKLGKVMWKRQRQKYKPLQSIYNLMHGLQHLPKRIMQKQAKAVNAKMESKW